MATKNRHNKIPKLISKRSSQSINRNKKKKEGERPRWGEMIHPKKISAWSSAHPVCQQFPSFNALMFRRQRDQDYGHDHAHAEKRDDDGQTDGATKPRQCHPLWRLDGIINAYSGLPFGHRQTPGSGNQDPGCSVWNPREPRLEARSVSGFWSSSGGLLIFFVFTLTFEAKRRKLIEGLISTHQAKDSPMTMMARWVGVNVAYD